MIKHLVTNGCSWTAGNELECDPKMDDIIKQLGLVKSSPNNPLDLSLKDSAGNYATSMDKFYDHFNWAGVLKEKLGAEQLTNLSVGAGSNARILRTTTDYVMQLSKDQRAETLVVVGWTTSERDEFYIGEGWQRWNATQPFSMTVDRLTMNDDTLIDKITKIQEDFILYIYNDYASVSKYFQQIYLLSNLLENLNIKYLFFNALPAFWEKGTHAFNVDVKTEFKEKIDWQNSHNNFLSTTKSMYNFINYRNYPVAPYLHPLSLGHADWADCLYKELDLRNII